MKLLTACSGVFLALLLGVAVSAHAQEATMGEGMSAGRTVEMQGFGKTLKDLEDRVNTSTTRLFKIKECHESGKIFAMLPDGTEGCKDVIPADQPQSGERTFATPGTYTFVVPPHNNLQVEVWGGGGGGGQGNALIGQYFAGTGHPGLKGGSSSFGGVIAANGGLGGMYGYSTMVCGGSCWFPAYPGSPGASGGTASGGSVNLNGNSGTAGYVYPGTGGAAITGATGLSAGAGGAAGGAIDPSFYYAIAYGTQFNPTAGAGGGGGGYARALYKAHTFNVGSVIQVVVGAGGDGGSEVIFDGEGYYTSGISGSKGSSGAVRLLWN